MQSWGRHGSHPLDVNGAETSLQTERESQKQKPAYLPLFVVLFFFSCLFWFFYLPHSLFCAQNCGYSFGILLCLDSRGWFVYTFKANIQIASSNITNSISFAVFVVVSLSFSPPFNHSLFLCHCQWLTWKRFNINFFFPWHFLWAVCMLIAGPAPVNVVWFRPLSFSLICSFFMCISVMFWLSVDSLAVCTSSFASCFHKKKAHGVFSLTFGLLWFHVFHSFLFVCLDICFSFTVSHLTIPFVP